VAGCQHGNEPSGFKNGWEFRDHLSHYQLLTNDSAPLKAVGHIIKAKRILHKSLVRMRQYKHDDVATWF
jgi:hypothetical protein